MSCGRDRMICSKKSLTNGLLLQLCWNIPHLFNWYRTFNQFFCVSLLLTKRKENLLGQNIWIEIQSTLNDWIRNQIEWTEIEQCQKWNRRLNKHKHSRNPKIASKLASKATDTIPHKKQFRCWTNGIINNCFFWVSVVNATKKCEVWNVYFLTTWILWIK